MTSRERWRGRPDRQVETFIQAALQERVTGRGPSRAAWERIATRCANDRLRVISGLMQWVTSVWIAWMNWTLPMFEAPAIRVHEQHLSGQNVHWTWLDHHRVNVRLAC